jgi:hypothetical protein
MTATITAAHDLNMPSIVPELGPRDLSRQEGQDRQDRREGREGQETELLAARPEAID